MVVALRQILEGKKSLHAKPMLFDLTSVWSLSIGTEVELSCSLDQWTSAKAAALHNTLLGSGSQ